MVADARTLSDIITELLSHPLQEFRTVGQQIKEEAETALPTLLAHARANAFLTEQHLGLRDVAATFGAVERVRGEGRPGTRLLAYDEHLDARLLASILFEQSDLPYATLLDGCKAKTVGERKALFERILDNRGSRDPLPMSLEGADPFDFELSIDFGAYRDIGRHRKGFQQQQLLTTAHGYLTPPLLRQAGLADGFATVLDRVASLQPVVASAHPHAAGYITPFAFLQRVRISFDPRQCAYFIELRSGPEGHFAYRQCAIDLFHAIREVSPLFASLIRVAEGEAFLGRMRSEQTADERRIERMERAGDL